ncbi:hypothetical protein Tco_0938924 [Tanacetum coccineum]|uniref:Ribosomal protein S14 n=1 Tax=Tanacetum coccineum TaxID=301880 RepID=A0ABQ5DPS7_9ASTR
MQKQKNSAGKRWFFSRKDLEGPQDREKFTVERYAFSQRSIPTSLTEDQYRALKRSELQMRFLHNFKTTRIVPILCKASVNRQRHHLIRGVGTHELAGIIKLSAFSSFSLFECRKVVTASKSPEAGNGINFLPPLCDFQAILLLPF